MNNLKLSIEYFGASDIGMVRVENQDSFGKFPPDNLDTYSDKGQLFIVADGIGGHTGGKEASSLAVETIRDTYFNSSLKDTSLSLQNAIEAANKAIHQKAKSVEKFGRMGTTSSVLVLKNDVGTIGQVGDSKVYKIENNRIEQLTMEHTQLNEMLKEGILTEEEAKNYPSKSVLSRALGMEEKVKVDLIENIILKQGQTFVLCSDGLAKVNKDEILNFVTQNFPRDACTELINLANERGGKDNVTVLVIKINAGKILQKISTVKEEKPKIERRGKNKWLFIIPVLITLLVIALQFGKPFINLINLNSKEKPEDINQSIEEENNLTQNNTDNDQILQAKQQLNKGNYEKALRIYQNVLENEPMNLSALEGVNSIASFYKNKADKLKTGKNFSEALEFYLRVQKIQPDNTEVINAILLCENQIKFSKDNSTSLSIEETSDNEVASNQINISGVNQSEWNFINIDKSQYEVDGNSIKFYNTSTEKKSLFSFDLNNAGISADIKIFFKSGNSGAGFILGYNRMERGNDENFYLLKFSSKYLTLQKFTNNLIEELLSAERANKSSSNEISLRVKCLGNLINIYDGVDLISSWKSPEKIYGKIGVYSDKNVIAKFQNILITGNQVQAKVKE